MFEFAYLWNTYLMNAKGVLHIGANRGQEALEYKKFGIKNVCWIEAIPDVFADLCNHLKAIDCLDENVTVINACIGDVDDQEVDFGISNNEAQSSSYLKLGHHLVIHPSVHMEKYMKMKTVRIDTLFRGNPKIRDYELLSVDIQGPELQALKSMGILLHHFKWAVIEVNMQETYVGCAMVEEIDEYMDIFGFVRAETAKWVADTWTDAFYIKKHLLQ